MSYFKTVFSAIVTSALITTAVPSFAQSSTSFPAIAQSIQALDKKDNVIKEFYAARNYKPIWVGNKNRARRTALIAALKTAGDHGLPAERYQAKAIQSLLNAARGMKGRGAAEAAASKMFLRYAQDISSGSINPASADKEIAVKLPRRNPQSLLEAMLKGNPKSVLAGLAPSHPHYKMLLDEKRRLERVAGGGDFGPKVPVATINPGTSSQSVVAMRSRLTGMGYGKLGKSPAYDDKLLKIVKQFQVDHGLNADGVMGPASITALNVPVSVRMKQIVVNLERQRWINFARGDRHVLVNIPDYSVNLIDKGKSSFYSRTVVGQVKEDRRTPEFYDTMTHMVINPTWNIPKSIAVKEYIPIMRKDSNFLKNRGMYIVNASGKPVSPSNEDLSKYNKNNFKTFPYFIKQKPDPRNALGLVKFMFPNKYNIYLHDTPSKSLFNKDVRAFSHGCVRVHKPFNFAYKLLERQYKNPEGSFKNFLATKKEKFVNLKNPVPVYITYSTAFFSDTGRPNYRADIYGRDAKVFAALSKAGVKLRKVGG
jgi:murein L,D-transpeptidase YcbB/YkuD